MCGRFVNFRNWRHLRDTLLLATCAELMPNYNVAPTQQVLVAREHNHKREGVVMRWGLIPSWAKDKKSAQINARADTAATKPMFRAAYKKRRCLILADGYYEWKKLGKEKQPYFYRLKADESFTFAGLWETWHDEETPIDSCAILTTESNALASEVRDRMPVILEGADALAWIDLSTDPGSLAQMLRPFDADKMTAYPVDAKVGNVRNHGPELIEPVSV